MSEIFERRGFLAGPAVAAEPIPTASGSLTREMLDAAIARISEAPVLRIDPAQARAELALARWLDEQPPGTAEKLLRRMYGEEEQS